MNFDSLILKKNTGFSIWSHSDINDKKRLRRNPTSPRNHRFFFVYKNKLQNKNIIPTEISVAHFFYSLEKPQPITPALKSVLGKYYFSIIACLIFDGIIQVSNTHSHKLESGPDSLFLRTVFSKLDKISKPVNKISKLSWNAIKYAWQFKQQSIAEITERLYSYGSAPRNYSLDCKLSHNKGILPWLDLISMQKTKRSIETNYILSHDPRNNKYWMSWQHRMLENHCQLIYKIYVSPLPEQTLEVFTKILPICDSLSIPAFKIGATINGIHRPDKMVLYFSDYKSLKYTALSLNQLLGKYEAQGVPFTFPLSQNAIISWAIEPFERFESSWRIFVSHSLAKTLKLYSFKTCGLNMESILHRLQLLEIDCNAWNRPKIHF